MSNDLLIARLAADLSPVRRRSATRELLLLAGLTAAELALVVVAGPMRHDLGHLAGSPYLTWKLGSLAALAAIGGTVAIRSFDPASSPRPGTMLALVLAGAAAIAGAFVAPGAGAGRSLLERIDPASGIVCAAAIIVLALPVMALLAVLMRRGAPASPGGSAIASGLAASTTGAFVFAFCCPVDDPLYIVVWYAAGCSAVVAVARWLLPRRFRL